MPFEEGEYRTEESGQFINTTAGFMIVVPEKLSRPYHCYDASCF
jgi:hypothetical protein